jgi:hypothetical protein
MNRYIPILQGHVYIARVGVGGVTADTAPATLVGEAPNPLYLKLGEALNGGLNIERETKEIIRIVGGRREKEDITLSETYTAKVTIQELNKLVIDMVFGSDTTATDDFIAAGPAGRKAWVYMQELDHASVSRLLLLGLATVAPAGEVPLFGEDVFKADFDFKFIGRPAGKLIGAYGS